MSDNILTGQQDPAQTGVEVGPVAGDQGGVAASDTTQSNQSNQGVDPSSIEKIVATRISQREQRIREEERQRVLQELQAQGYQSPQPMQPNYPDLNQLNDQFYQAFIQNPAQTVYQLASAISQQHVAQVNQQLKELVYRQNLMQLATTHMEDIQQVAPLMKPILDKYPQLRDTYEGLELAYNAAKGQLSNQVVQSAVERERQLMTQTNQAMAGAVPQGGTANQQGGGNPSKSPEEQVVDMILNAK